MSRLAILLFSFICYFAPEAQAAFSPLSVGILPPIEFPPEDFTITGARLSVLWGDQRDIYGIDLGGIGNITDLTFTGLAVSGVFNITHGTTTVLGLQLAGIANVNTNKTHVVGLQLAGAVNANSAESALTGLQVALFANLSEHTNIYGAQIGLYNRAAAVYGFQIGVVNVANSLHGLQLGLLNYNTTGLLAVSPILNVGF